MEAAEKDSKPLQGSKDFSIKQISKAQRQTNWKQSQSCYQCWKANHHPSQCCFIGTACLQEPVGRPAILLQYATLEKTIRLLQPSIRLKLYPCQGQNQPQKGFIM